MKTINYIPPRTIKDFIGHFVPHELFFDWIIGPVGSGKTTGIFFKLIYMATRQQPSPVDGVRRTRAVIVRNTMPQLKDTTLTSWNYWFKDGEAGRWNATDKIFTLRFGDCECEVMFRPLDTADDVDRVLSLEVTFAIIDEFVQIPEKIIEALAARCGRYPAKLDGGATHWGMWGSSNPGNEDDWWFDYLHENKPANVMLFEQPSGFSAEAENVDNLPGQAGYYSSLEVGKSAHWVKQFIEVQWGFSIAGKPVVPTFNPRLHIAEGILKPNPHLPLIIGYDPGLGGSALILTQLDLDGRCLVFDELIQEDFGTDRLVTDRLKPLLRAKYRDFEVVIAPDPAADGRASSNERSSVDVMRKDHKLTVRFPGDMDNKIAPRLNAIEHFTTRITTKGPALQIAPHCKGLIRSLQGGWRYALNKRGERGETDPEKNHHSHAGDGFSYACRYHQYSGAREARRKTYSAPPQRAGNIYAMQ